MPLLKILETESSSFPAQELKVPHSATAGITEHDGNRKYYNLNVAIAVMTIISESEATAVFDMELRDKNSFRGEAPREWVHDRMRYQHGHGVLPASYSFEPKPVEGSTEKPEWVIGLVIGVALLLVLIGFLSSENDRTSPVKTTDKQREAVVYCQMYAKNALKNPSSADFPWSDEAKAIGGDEFVLASYVDAENSFGAKIRTQYACHVKYAGGGYQGWKLIDFRTF